MGSLDVRPLTGTIGAEIAGIDPADELTPSVVSEIRQALLRHQLLVFRDVTITPEGQVDFARYFGEIHLPPVRTSFEGPPEVNVLDQTSGKGDADRWHNDNTYLAEPPMGSILHVVKVPFVGGDTCFASMYAAYEALSPSVRRFVDELRAEHDVSRSLLRAVSRGQTALDVAATRAKYPPVIHPVVITHPETGRRALFVNRQSTTRIVDVTDEESDMVLSFLYDHIKSPEFHCRVRWDEHTLLFLDNRCAQHYAVPDYHDRRVLHRVTIKGDRPA